MSGKRYTVEFKVAAVKCPVPFDHKRACRIAPASFAVILCPLVSLKLATAAIK